MRDEDVPLVHLVHLEEIFDFFWVLSPPSDTPAMAFSITHSLELTRFFPYQIKISMLYSVQTTNFDFCW